MSSFFEYELKPLIKTRNELMQCIDIKDIAKRSLEIILSHSYQQSANEKIIVKSASLFIFSKEGLVERINIIGKHNSKKVFLNNIFIPEKYLPGKNFSSNAIPEIKTKESFGVPQWSENIIKDKFINNEILKKYYIDYLGIINSGLSLPLNGKYHTFGALEILKEDKCIFHPKDMYYLYNIATTISNFISDYRKRHELKVFENMARKLVNIDLENVDYNINSVFEYAVKEIIHPNTSFEVCILRVLNRNSNKLEVKEQDSHSNISFENYNFQISNLHEGTVGEVFKTKAPKYILDVVGIINKFKNKEWIIKNNLHSYACIPMLINDEVHGTISVFTSYYHDFSDNDKLFLNNMGDFCASVVSKSYVSQQLSKIRIEREKERERFLNTSLTIGFDSLLEGILHRYKNELIALKYDLEELSKKSSLSIKQKESIIQNLYKWANRRIKEISDELKSDIRTPVDINASIKSVIKILSLEKSSIPIKVILKLDNSLPVIELNEAKFKDIIYNLISNAEKAILLTQKKNGEITLETSIKFISNEEYIEILVSDNGIGIPHEISDTIFNKGFSTDVSQGGSGMGLFIVKEIIEGYDGSIYYDSSVGKGTTFTVLLPLD